MANKPNNASRTAKKGNPAMRGFYILLIAVAVVGIGSLSYLSTRSKGNTSQWDSTLPKLAAQGHVEGSDSAKLEVIEFADFECPVCAQFASVTEPDVRTHLIDSGVVRLRYIDFPLSQHRNTWNAHRAAWCAGDQGKFWEMHDALYNRQDQWHSEATDKPDNVITGFAQGLGLNMDQFGQCLKDRKYQAQLQANEQEAERRKVDATPTFVFGTKVVSGDLTYDQFKTEVEGALARQTPAGSAGGAKK